MRENWEGEARVKKEANTRATCSISSIHLHLHPGGVMGVILRRKGREGGGNLEETSS